MAQITKLSVMGTPGAYRTTVVVEDTNIYTRIFTYLKIIGRVGAKAGRWGTSQ